MRVTVMLALFVFAVVAAAGRPALAAPVCERTDEGQLRCTIRTLGDCQAIEDYPYARNLFCPAAFAAAQAMVAEVAKTLGMQAPAGGVFHYFQTLADPLAPPDDQAQTTVACMDTPAPWGGQVVEGAGAPLCHLVAYVTSPGPVPGRRGFDQGNPLPDALRQFPHYFGRLFSWRGSLPLTEFRSGSTFDGLVRGLGRAGSDGFMKDYPSFSTREIYDPASWSGDPQYHGISGGGGGGWGGEIAVARRRRYAGDAARLWRGWRRRHDVLSRRRRLGKGVVDPGRGRRGRHAVRQRLSLQGAPLQRSRAGGGHGQ